MLYSREPRKNIEWHGSCEARRAKAGTAVDNREDFDGEFRAALKSVGGQSSTKMLAKRASVQPPRKIITGTIRPFSGRPSLAPSAFKYEEKSSSPTKIKMSDRILQKAQDPDADSEPKHPGNKTARSTTSINSKPPNPRSRAALPNEKITYT